MRFFQCCRAPIVKGEDDDEAPGGAVPAAEDPALSEVGRCVQPHAAERAADCHREQGLQPADMRPTALQAVVHTSGRPQL